MKNEIIPAYERTSKLYLQFIGSESLRRAALPLAGGRLAMRALYLTTQPIYLSAGEPDSGGMPTHPRDVQEKVDEYTRRVWPLIGKKIPLAPEEVSIETRESVTDIRFELNLDDEMQEYLSAGRIFGSSPAIDEWAVFLRVPNPAPGVASLALRRQIKAMNQIISSSSNQALGPRIKFLREHVRCRGVYDDYCQ